MILSLLLLWVCVLLELEIQIQNMFNMIILMLWCNSKRKSFEMSVIVYFYSELLKMCPKTIP